MMRLNRTWLGVFLITLGTRVLPDRIRDEWDVKIQRKVFEMPHQFDTSRFDGRESREAGA